jgi:hypothetical protein
MKEIIIIDGKTGEVIFKNDFFVTIQLETYKVTISRKQFDNLKSNDLNKIRSINGVLSSYKSKSTEDMFSRLKRVRGSCSTKR